MSYTYIKFDLETTVNGGPDKDSPEAHWHDNEVLLCGWMDSKRSDNVNISRSLDSLVDHIVFCQSRGEKVTLIAHNAKFDIKYLMREDTEIYWPNISVWDTMTWEYLYSGHTNIMPSLEDTAKARGVPFTKSLDLDDMLSSGIKMDQIPIKDLNDYLEGDVKVLHYIFSAQAGLDSDIWMDYILPLAEMELNGLPFNKDKAVALATDLQQKVNDAEAMIARQIQTRCEWQDGSPVTLEDFSNVLRPKTKFIKPTSNRTISMLLTGYPNELKITQKWRLKLKGNSILPRTVVQYIWEDIQPTHVGLPVDEKTMEIVSTQMEKMHIPTDLVDNLMEYRKSSKIVSTYLMPMIRQANIQGTVHPKLNTAITATGRLSSSAPNGQNMPPIVRELIEAHHKEWRMEELDFSQLEIVCAAALSGCPDLAYDLNHGVDVHERTAQGGSRKVAKAVNFGVLYGGKAHGLSKLTGVEKPKIVRLIKAFYNAYPRVKQWQEEFFREVVTNMVPYRIEEGCQRYKSTITLPNSKRRFTFKETKAPSWVRKRTGSKWAFSPNHTANYPIQGFAGGDVVMRALYYLWCDLRNIAWFRLTVHDSILIEKAYDDDFTDVYDQVCEVVKLYYNLPVPLNYDVETDTHWS